ncbi:hypothetical protein B0J17DRAFT_150789 [Rhizoctonia solani]|nr:hypothetical protein B0J17DRAFT_404658 [Rhizoctonia solani]KAH7332529.1 hypothetical protein B0J17DRAFT_150789 [Rhizoctonia solani]
MPLPGAWITSTAGARYSSLAATPQPTFAFESDRASIPGDGVSPDIRSSSRRSGFVASTSTFYPSAASIWRQPFYRCALVEKETPSADVEPPHQLLRPVAQMWYSNREHRWCAIMRSQVPCGSSLSRVLCLLPTRAPFIPASVVLFHRFTRAYADSLLHAKSRANDLKYAPSGGAQVSVFGKVIGRAGRKRAREVYIFCREDRVQK